MSFSWSHKTQLRLHEYALVCTCTLNLMTSLNACSPKQVHLNRSQAESSYVLTYCISVKLVPMCWKQDKLPFGRSTRPQNGPIIPIVAFFFFRKKNFCHYNQPELLIQLMMAGRRDFGRVREEEPMPPLIRGFHVTFCNPSLPNAVNSG